LIEPSFGGHNILENIVPMWAWSNNSQMQVVDYKPIPAGRLAPLRGGLEFVHDLDARHGSAYVRNDDWRDNAGASLRKFRPFCENAGDGR